MKINNLAPALLSLGLACEPKPVEMIPSSPMEEASIELRRAIGICGHYDLEIIHQEGAGFIEKTFVIEGVSQDKWTCVNGLASRIGNKTDTWTHAYDAGAQRAEFIFRIYED